MARWSRFGGDDIPAEGELLVYDTTTGLWINNTKAEASIFDPTISSPADNEVIAYDNGSSAWINQTASEAGLAPNTGGIGIIIDGSGAAIAVGVVGFIEVPFACTLTAVRMVADQSTTTTIDIWKDTYANFPPTNADTITGGNEPAITAGIKDEDTTLTSWTTAMAAGDWLAINVDANDNAVKLTLAFRYTRA